MAKAKRSPISSAISDLQDAMMKAYGKDGEGEIGQADMEELVKLATEIINRDYYADVRGIAADLIRQIKDGEITSEDQLNEAIDQDTDGSARVIYTFQAKLGLIASGNEDAYEEELGTKPDSPEAAMVMAMRADVRARLDNEGVDDLLRAARDGDEDDD
jgi:hypothetical protein